MAVGDGRVGFTVVVFDDDTYIDSYVGRSWWNVGMSSRSVRYSMISQAR
jgi:hypothetical protein